MNTNTFRFTKAIAGAALIATAVTGIGATAAVAAPAPTAPGTSHSAAAEQNGHKKVAITLVNNTDEVLKDNETLILPGQSLSYPAIRDNDVVQVFGEKSRSYYQLTATNPIVGSPVAKAFVSINDQVAQRAESQGTEEHDSLVTVGGIEVSSYRHSDTANKNFTFTITKHSAATMGADNTKSTANAYVRVDGNLHAIRKGEAAALPQLNRGANRTIDIQTGGQYLSLQVTWAGNQAVFSSPGRATATLANGQSVNYGLVTVQRVDANNGTTTNFQLVFGR